MELFGKQPIAVLELPDDHPSVYLKEVLINAGFYVEESFNLLDIQNFKDGSAGHCLCNLVVFLVYSDYGNPITLTIDHSSKKSLIYLYNENNLITETSLLGLFAKLSKDGS